MKQNNLEIQKGLKKGDPIKAILSIEDELSFINALTIGSEIQKHINEFDQLTIEARIAHIDLTGIQLLFSIKKTCESVNKSVIFKVKMGDELKILVLKAGFDELFENQLN